MAMTLDELGIDGLSRDERLELIGVLWDSIVDADAAPDLTDEQRAELDRRVAGAEADPDAGVPWEEVRARLLGAP